MACSSEYLGIKLTKSSKDSVVTFVLDIHDENRKLKVLNFLRSLGLTPNTQPLDNGRLLICVGIPKRQSKGVTKELTQFIHQKNCSLSKSLDMLNMPGNIDNILPEVEFPNSQKIKKGTVRFSNGLPKDKPKKNRLWKQVLNFFSRKIKTASKNSSLNILLKRSTMGPEKSEKTVPVERGRSSSASMGMALVKTQVAQATAAVNIRTQTRAAAPFMGIMNTDEGSLQTTCSCCTSSTICSMCLASERKHRGGAPLTKSFKGNGWWPYQPKAILCQTSAGDSTTSLCFSTAAHAGSSCSFKTSREFVYSWNGMSRSDRSSEKIISQMTSSKANKAYVNEERLFKLNKILSDKQDILLSWFRCADDQSTTSKSTNIFTMFDIKDKKESASVKGREELSTIKEKIKKLSNKINDLAVPNSQPAVATVDVGVECKQGINTAVECIMSVNASTEVDFGGRKPGRSALEKEQWRSRNLQNAVAILLAQQQRVAQKGYRAQMTGGQPPPSRVLPPRPLPPAPVVRGTSKDLEKLLHRQQKDIDNLRRVIVHLKKNIENTYSSGSSYSYSDDSSREDYHFLISRPLAGK